MNTTNKIKIFRNGSTANCEQYHLDLTNRKIDKTNRRKIIQLNSVNEHQVVSFCLSIQLLHLVTFMFSTLNPMRFIDLSQLLYAQM